MKTAQAHYRFLLASAVLGLAALLGGCSGGNEGGAQIVFPEGTAPAAPGDTPPGATENTGGGVTSGDPSQYTR